MKFLIKEANKIAKKDFFQESDALSTQSAFDFYIESASESPELSKHQHFFDLVSIRELLVNLTQLDPVSFNFQIETRVNEATHESIWKSKKTQIVKMVQEIRKSSLNRVISFENEPTEDKGETIPKYILERNHSFLKEDKGGSKNIETGGFFAPENPRKVEVFLDKLKEILQKHECEDKNYKVMALVTSKLAGDYLTRKALEHFKDKKNLVKDHYSGLYNISPSSNRPSQVSMQKQEENKEVNSQAKSPEKKDGFMPKNSPEFIEAEQEFLASSSKKVRMDLQESEYAFGKSIILSNIEVQIGVVSPFDALSIRTVLISYKPNFLFVFFGPELILMILNLHHFSLPEDQRHLHSVSFYSYKSSFEEKNFKKSDRDSNAFHSLILSYSKLPKFNETAESRINLFEYSNVSNTRKGQGASFKEEQTRPTIIIDKREFKCDLPAHLFMAGFLVKPLFLETGDYILTPEIGVERKSIATGDLFSSLKGRLSAQIRKMQESFKIVILLIELDESTMSINSGNTVDHFGGPNTRKKTKEPRGRFKKSGNGEKKSSDKETEVFKDEDNVAWKLAKLVIKYPRLRILWSMNPEHTVRIFKSLKDNKPEPETRSLEAFAEKIEKTQHDFELITQDSRV